MITPRIFGYVAALMIAVLMFGIFLNFYGFLQPLKTKLLYRESTPSRVETKIPIYYGYAIPDKNKMGPFTDNNDHSLLDAAIVSAKWALVNPREGVLDWKLLDKKISDWTGSTNPDVDTPKKIFILIAPYTQDPLTAEECVKYGLQSCEPGDNNGTPPWIYRQGVPRITFVCGGVCRGQKTTSVPKVWDPSFLVRYEAFLKALGERYDNDKRVLGFQPGFGHLGTLNAQPSPGSGEAFAAAGWTLEIWQQYVKTIINISGKYFTKPQLLSTPGQFLEGKHCGSARDRKCGLTDNAETAKGIIGYAAQKGVWINFRGLHPIEEQFNESFAPELVRYLATLNLPQGFRMGFSDDWPLFVPPDRSTKCPGPTCGRDEEGFDKELSYAFKAWDSINRKFPIFFIFLQPVASATNQNRPKCTEEEKSGDDTCFRKSAFDVVQKWILGKDSLPAPAPAPTPTPPPPYPQPPPQSQPPPSGTLKPGSYSTVNSARTFNLYTARPIDPIYILIHGGGWRIGDKDDRKFVADLKTVRDRGFNVYSINYRLSGEAIWPAQINDVKCMLGFLASNPETAGDESRIVLGGHSAGAHLAIMAALTAKTDFDDDCEWTGRRYRIIGVAVSSPAIDLTNMSPRGEDAATALLGYNPDANLAGALAASPIQYPSSDDPQVLVLTGGLDELTKASENGQAFFDAFKVVEKRIEWHNFPDLGHQLDITNPDGQTFPEILKFLNKLLVN